MILVDVRTQAERELSPSSKITGPQIDQSLKQYTDKRLLDHHRLRASAFSTCEHGHGR